PRSVDDLHGPRRPPRTRSARVVPHPAGAHNAWAVQPTQKLTHSTVSRALLRWTYMGHDVCCTGDGLDGQTRPLGSDSGPDESPIRRLATSRRVARHLNAQCPLPSVEGPPPDRSPRLGGNHVS